MDVQQFDRIAKFLARRRTRRDMLRGGLALGVAATAGAASGRLAAQEATPAAGIEVVTNPHPAADVSAEPEFLFVQHFSGGTWTPKAGEEGVYSLALTGAPAQTVYFSDRPERIFGTSPTAEFLEYLGFTPANPPNAALVARRSEGDEQEVLVIELLNPSLDTASGTLSYDAKVLVDYGEGGLAHAARQQTDYTLPETFGAGGLFIDGILDCSDEPYSCYDKETRYYVGRVSVGTCHVGGPFSNQCTPCRPPEHVCAEQYPAECLYRSYDAQGNLTGIAYTCAAEN